MFINEDDDCFIINNKKIPKSNLTSVFYRKAKFSIINYRILAATFGLTICYPLVPIIILYQEHKNVLLTIKYAIIKIVNYIKSDPDLKSLYPYIPFIAFYFLCVITFKFLLDKWRSYELLTVYYGMPPKCTTRGKKKFIFTCYSTINQFINRTKI